MEMNLYQVYPRNDDWCCFVFAKSRGRAKSLLTRYFSEDHDYIGFGCKTLRKDVGGAEEICDVNCDRLKALGCEYGESDGDLY